MSGKSTGKGNRSKFSPGGNLANTAQRTAKQTGGRNRLPMTKG